MNKTMFPPPCEFHPTKLSYAAPAQSLLRAWAVKVVSIFCVLMPYPKVRGKLKSSASGLRTSAQSALNVLIFKKNEEGIKFQIFLFNWVHKMYPSKGKS